MARKFLATVTLLRALGGREWGANMGTAPDQSLPEEGGGSTEVPVDPATGLPVDPATGAPLPSVPPVEGAPAPSQPIYEGGPAYPTYLPAEPDEGTEGSTDPDGEASTKPVEEPIFPPPHPDQELPLPRNRSIYFLAYVPAFGSWKYLKVEIGSREERKQRRKARRAERMGEDRPDQDLPGRGHGGGGQRPRPDQGLPGQGGQGGQRPRPDQGLPPQGNYPSGQPVPGGGNYPDTAPEQQRGDRTRR